MTRIEGAGGVSRDEGLRKSEARRSAGDDNSSTCLQCGAPAAPRATFCLKCLIEIERKAIDCNRRGSSWIGKSGTGKRDRGSKGSSGDGRNRRIRPLGRLRLNRGRRSSSPALRAGACPERPPPFPPVCLPGTGLRRGNPPRASDDGNGTTSPPAPSPHFFDRIAMGPGRKAFGGPCRRGCACPDCGRDRKMRCFGGPLPPMPSRRVGRVRENQTRRRDDAGDRG
jgi:ribosomal protein L40E